MIAPSTPLCRWQVSDVLATRYDVPDQPMQGEMDAAFFLTSDKQLHPARISLPHRIRRRAPRPPARGARRAALQRATGCPSARRGSTSPASGSARPGSPPGRAPRIDVAAAGAGPVPPRHLRRRRPLRRRRRGRLARRPTRRNKEAEAIFAADLPAGDDHARGLLRRPRRARRPLLLPARLAGRPARARRHCRSTPTPRGRRRSRPRSRRMHFERPAYTGGEVALRPAAPARPPRPHRRRDPRRLHASPAAATSTAASRPAQTRLILADAAEPARRLPRTSASTLDAGGFAAARVLGVEIARAARRRARHASPPASPRRSRRRRPRRARHGHRAGPPRHRPRRRRRPRR